MELNIELEYRNPGNESTKINKVCTDEHQKPKDITLYLMSTDQSRRKSKAHRYC